MGVGFEEFCAATVQAIGHRVHTLPDDYGSKLTDVAELIDGDPDVFPERAAPALRAALETIYVVARMVVECELAYEDGGRVTDDELQRKLTEHYGRPTKPTWS
ncbi:MAG: hypothetical protein QOJ97_250 [Solirubrobacteraceae bacterium]|jgi:hypothetical protein|nr:hypothetical protein [Solirubrobacteraceae bacterium]